MNHACSKTSVPPSSQSERASLPGTAKTPTVRRGRRRPPTNEIGSPHRRMLHSRKDRSVGCRGQDKTLRTACTRHLKRWDGRGFTSTHGSNIGIGGSSHQRLGCGQESAVTLRVLGGPHLSWRGLLRASERITGRCQQISSYALHTLTGLRVPGYC